MCLHKRKSRLSPQPPNKQLQNSFFLTLTDDYVVGTAADKEGALIFPNTITADYLEFMVSGELVPKALAGDLKEPEGLGAMRVFRGKERTIIGLRVQLGDGLAENQQLESLTFL
jgi:hypothetical protein